MSNPTHMVTGPVHWHMAVKSGVSQMETACDTRSPRNTVHWKNTVCNATFLAGTLNPRMATTLRSRNQKTATTTGDQDTSQQQVVR